MFPPGERTSYASLTFGHMIGEVIRRVDGRPIGQFLQEEVAQPLGADIYLGVPDAALAARGGADQDASAGAAGVRRAHGRRARRQSRGDDFQPARGPAVRHSWLGRHHERARTGAALRHAGQRRRAGRSARPVTRGAFARRPQLQSYELDEVYRVRVRRALGYRLGPDCGPGRRTDGVRPRRWRRVIRLRRSRAAISRSASPRTTSPTTPVGPPARRVGQVVADAVFAALGLAR